MILLKKLTIQDVQTQQIIDTRLQHDYQSGSFKDAINIPYAKFKKVAPPLLDSQRPLIFILENEDKEVIQLLERQTNNPPSHQVDGYLLVTEIPTEKLVKAETISAHDFLSVEEDYILLDVRDQASVTKPAPTKNLVAISLNDLANEYNQLGTKKEIFTLCGSGNSATTAASFLKNKGLKATVIEGGVTAIQKEQEK